MRKTYLPISIGIAICCLFLFSSFTANAQNISNIINNKKFECLRGIICRIETFEDIEPAYFTGGKDKTPSENEINGCTTYTLGVNWYHGEVLMWTYRQRITWCYANNLITSLSRADWPSVYSPFYQWIGRESLYQNGGVGYYHYDAFVVGQFKFLGIMQIFPAIHQYVYGDGQYLGWVDW